MRAAAMKQYPDLFGKACNFFGLVNSAVLTRARSKLIAPSKVGAMGWLVHAAMQTPWMLAACAMLLPAKQHTPCTQPRLCPGAAHTMVQRYVCWP
jgi:hypothetical protein